MMKLFKLGLVLAVIFAGISCDDKDDGSVAPIEEKINLTKVVMADCYRMDAYDVFSCVFATGEVVDNGETMHTQNDGYVVTMNLISKPATDATNLLPADGEYVLAKKIQHGCIDEDVATVVTFKKADGTVETLKPEEGGINLEKKNGRVTVFGKWMCGNRTLVISFDGALSFNELIKPVNTAFVGGQACFLGADRDFPELGCVRLELYDAEPDDALGTVYGNIVKSKMYINMPTGKFSRIPVGVYEVGTKAKPFALEPGRDNGVDIPTGTYIAQTLSTDRPMKLSMINEGKIVVRENGYVDVELVTEKGVTVKGSLNKKLEIQDLSGDESGEEEPQNPEDSKSGLTEDKVVDLVDVNLGYLYEYGDQYKNGTRNVVIQVLSEKTMIGFLLDLALPGAEPGTPLAEGVYHMDNVTHGEYTYAPGTILGPNAIGTWPYVELYRDGKHIMVDLNASGNALGGTLEIVRNGEEYTIVFDMTDDAPTPHKITGSWTGKFLDESYVSGACVQLQK